MLEDYCTQSGEWKHKTGIDDYNQPSYDTKTIDCRILDQEKLVRNKQGEQILSTSTVFTQENVQLDDLINGRTVIGRKSLDLLDETDGWEVYLT